MNTNFYASETAKLMLGALDDRNYPRTAWRYLPAGDPDANLMYAYKISRNCAGESNCLPLSAPRLHAPDARIQHSPGRLYPHHLEPATKADPGMPEILYERVMKFSPRPST